jgi:hypothetical protein
MTRLFIASILLLPKPAMPLELIDFGNKIQDFVGSTSARSLYRTRSATRKLLGWKAEAILFPLWMLLTDVR